MALFQKRKPLQKKSDIAPPPATGCSNTRRGFDAPCAKVYPLIVHVGDEEYDLSTRDGAAAFQQRLKDSQK